MTAAITLWLAFALATGAVAWFGPKRQAVAFVVIALATAPAALLTLGHPTFMAPPKGQLTVLGAKIEQYVAIYVLIDGDEPRYYRLPYSQAAADQLQSALDGTADGEGKVGMIMGEGASPGFAEIAPPPEPEKRAERSIIGG